ncbi:MAG TPA: PLDc N-terminal domain-containing protein [Virgibacillus sp.]|nr:PLDc N-terminal domain-containing protein [Virgibacillus sp.]
MQESLAAIDWGIIMPLLVIQAILMVIALIDLWRTEDTNGPKNLWLIIIIFISILGPILYFVIGRRNH